MSMTALFFNALCLKHRIVGITYPFTKPASDMYKSMTLGPIKHVQTSVYIYEPHQEKTRFLPRLQVGLRRTWSETPKICFLMMRLM